MNYTIDDILSQNGFMTVKATVRGKPVRLATRDGGLVTIRQWLEEIARDSRPA